MGCARHRYRSHRGGVRSGAARLSVVFGTVTVRIGSRARGGAARIWLALDTIAVHIRAAFGAASLGYGLRAAPLPFA